MRAEYKIDKNERILSLRGLNFQSKGEIHGNYQFHHKGCRLEKEGFVYNHDYQKKAIVFTLWVKQFMTLKQSTHSRCCLIYFKFLKNSHITIPPQTETLRECLVPNCGISRHSSKSDKISSEIPSTSFPKTKAYF